MVQIVHMRGYLNRYEHFHVNLEFDWKQLKPLNTKFNFGNQCFVQSMNGLKQAICLYISTQDNSTTKYGVSREQ